MINNSFLIVLLLFHFIADFYFQSHKMALAKDENIKSLFIHCIIYLLTFSLLFIIYRNSWNLIFCVSLIGISHFVVDFIKFIINLDTKLSKNFVFSLDQLIHILIILGIFYYFDKGLSFVNRFDLNPYLNILKLTISVLIILKPTNIFIKSFFEESDNEVKEKRLGRIIGNLERLLITVLLLANQFVVIGYVFAAKSIARWKNFEERDFAEYYLIGTLLSVLVSIVIYFLFLYNSNILNMG